METVEPSGGHEPHGDDPVGVGAVVRAYYAALNDGRWADLADLFHEDAVLLAPSQRPTIGRATMLAFYESHADRFPDSAADVVLLMHDGNRALTLVDLHRVDQGGRTTRLWTSGTFTVDGGRIRQHRMIFDTAELEGQAPPTTEGEGRQ